MATPLLETKMRFTIFAILIAICLAQDAKKKLFFRKDYQLVEEFDAFYKVHRAMQNFSDAVAICNAESAKMVVPETKAEAEAVTKLASQDMKLFWVGVHDRFSEGSFITLDGVPIEELYINWGENEPNNVGGDENCVIIGRDAIYNDVACSTRRNFICKKVTQDLTQNPSCETYDLAYEYKFEFDQCYKLHTTPMTWKAAFRTCKAEESSLAIVNSEAEAQMMVNELAKYPQESLKGSFEKRLIHLGFSDLINNGVFLTTEGKTLEEAGYENWAQGEPNSVNNNEHCGSLLRNGGLNDNVCDSRAMFFCEKKLSSHNVAIPVKG